MAKSSDESIVDAALAIGGLLGLCGLGQLWEYHCVGDDGIIVSFTRTGAPRESMGHLALVDGIGCFVAATLLVIGGFWYRARFCRKDGQRK